MQSGVVRSSCVECIGRPTEVRRHEVPPASRRSPGAERASGPTRPSTRNARRRCAVITDRQVVPCKPLRTGWGAARFRTGRTQRTRPYDAPSIGPSQRIQSDRVPGAGIGCAAHAIRARPLWPALMDSSGRFPSPHSQRVRDRDQFIRERVRDPIARIPDMPPLAHVQDSRVPPPPRRSPRLPPLHYLRLERGEPSDSTPSRLHLDRTDSDVTRLLTALSDGEPHAMDQLLPVIYDELKILAASQLRRERGEHTLGATALVHEAFLRLVDQRDVDWRGRSHFFGIAAQAMRRILVDHARRRSAQATREGATPAREVRRPAPASRDPRADSDRDSLAASGSHCP